MTTQPQTDDDIRLETIAKYIERLQVGAILEVAEQLAKAHEIFRYRHDEGGFKGWVERRLTFSRRTAYKLLEIHKQFGGKESVHLCTQILPRSVLYLLAAPSTPKEAREAVIARAESGERLSVKDVRNQIGDTKAKADSVAVKQPKAATCALDPEEDADATEDNPVIAECVADVRERIDMAMDDIARNEWFALTKRLHEAINDLSIQRYRAHRRATHQSDELPDIHACQKRT